jgi:mono/diheme cytochrome c family protein
LINATRFTLTVIAACALARAAIVQADAPDGPSPGQIKKGAATYSQNCSPCHGPRMLDPQGAFDLRTFPKDQKERFLTSVSKGKNQMPPWGGLLSAEDIESLWAYVTEGEK